MAWVRATNELRGDQFLDRIHGLVNGAGGIGLRAVANRRGGRGLFFRQAIDEVIHNHISESDVLARTVLEVIATNREAVAVASEQEYADPAAKG